MKLTYSDSTHAYFLDGKRAKSVTSVAKIPVDTFTLEQWAKRQVAIGMTLERRLAERIAVDLDNREAIQSVCEDASRIAGAHHAADRGTQRHRASELADTLAPFISDQQRADAAVWLRTLDAHGIEIDPTLVEQFVAYPDHGVVGRFDRVAMLDGRHAIVDLKGLAIDTPIPTPQGWTTMRRLQIGDRVFGGDGRACTILAKSGTRYVDCHRIRFDDASTPIICDSEHRWATLSGRYCMPEVHTTEDIEATLRQRDQCQHRVANAGPLVLPEADLPIDPYVFGCWIGDGKRSSGEITKTEDLFQEISRCGYQLGARTSIHGECGTRSILGIRKQLRLAGILGHKHIPDMYMRASREQRLALVQGLMDTDGTWNTRRRQGVFSSTDKGISESFRELIVSLGSRAHITPIVCHGFGVTAVDHRVPFTPVDFMPFRIARKAIKVNSRNRPRSRRRVITSVTPAPIVATQCVLVDSPDHTYLCGDQMIPTHNSGVNAVRYPQAVATQLALYARAPHVSAAVVTDGDHSTVTEWTTMPDDLDLDRGYIVLIGDHHDDIGELWELDIAHGWEGGQLALRLVDWRRSRNYGQSLAAKVLAPAASVPPPAAEDRRVWVTGRIDALADDAGARHLLAQRWPEGVALPQEAQHWTDNDVTALAASLSEVEGRIAAPFANPDPVVVVTQEAARAPAPTLGSPAKAPTLIDLDEGGPAAPEDVGAIQAAVARLDAPRRHTVMGWAREGDEQGRPWAGLDMTRRTWAVAQAAVACGRHLHDDDEPSTLTRAALAEVLGADLPPAWWTGAVLGSLTIDQAGALIGLAERFGAGDKTSCAALGARAAAITAT